MKRRLMKEVRRLRSDVSRNWIELCKVKRELAQLHSKKNERTISMMQTSVREMLVLSREL